MIDQMIRDAGQDVTEPGLWIETVQLSGFDERVDWGGTLAACFRPGEEMAFAAKGKPVFPSRRSSKFKSRMIPKSI